MKTSLRAILFDFDGVLADSEPLHLRMFQQVLSGEGITLSREEYFEKYLGLDDRGCFEQVFKDRGLALSLEKQQALIRKKNESLLAAVRGRSLLMPGAEEAVKEASRDYFLAIVSGALKSEISAILESAGLSKTFHVIVAADDVSEGKPSPEGFSAAVRLLNRDFVPPAEILLPEECLAIEDSPWGVEAAHRAGNKCVGVLTSYPAERMKAADLVLPDLTSFPWPSVRALFPLK